MRLLLTSILLSISFISVADIPAPPIDPEAACKHGAEGKKCEIFSSGRFESGVCQTVADKLTCVIAKDGTAVGNVHANEAPSDDKVVANTPEKPVDEHAAVNTAPEQANVNAQGCTNFAPMATNLVSILSVLFGLGLALRFRRR